MVRGALTVTTPVASSVPCAGRYKKAYFVDLATSEPAQNHVRATLRQQPPNQENSLKDL